MSCALADGWSPDGPLIVPAGEFGAVALAVFRHALARLERPVIGLPTGRTPVPLYKQMAFERFAFPEDARLFAIDEYCSRGLHPGTNAAFFARYLPEPAYPLVRVPLHDAVNPEAEIRTFCREIGAAGGFDLAVLGIGSNGHIAFNEPGSGSESCCRAVELAAPTRALVANEWRPAPTHGMTVGMADLLSARCLVLLASGAAKAAILAAALQGPMTPDVPASLLQAHSAVTVVCDVDAGALLRKP